MPSFLRDLHTDRYRQDIHTHYTHVCESRDDNREMRGDHGADFGKDVEVFEPGREVFEGEGNAFQGGFPAPLVGFLEQLFELLSLSGLCI